MKKLFLALACIAACMSYGQISVPSGTVTATTNPATGNVGIGTTTPTEKLEVNGNVMALDIVSGGTNNWVFHTPDDGRTDFFIAPKSGTNYDWNNSTLFKNNGDVVFNGTLTAADASINSVPWTNEPNAKIGFHITEKMTMAQSGLQNSGGVARYGMTYSNFNTASTFFPGISVSGYYGINFYTTDGERMRISSNGFLGIGTSNPTEKLDVVGNSKISGKASIGGNTFPTNTLYTNYNLFVKGGILTDEVRVALSSGSTWADYVFAKDYNLKPLSEVEAFIAKNKHLPNVPSAAQVKEEGINVGDMARIQQEKIEELTLYIIEQNKRIEALEAKMNTK